MLSPLLRQSTNSPPVANNHLWCTRSISKFNIQMHNWIGVTMFILVSSLPGLISMLYDPFLLQPNNMATMTSERARQLPAEDVCFPKWWSTTLYIQHYTMIAITNRIITSIIITIILIMIIMNKLKCRSTTANECSCQEYSAASIGA